MKKVKTPPPPERQEKRLLTNEDWVPTRDDGTVRAAFMQLPYATRSGRNWRVCLWGEDDFGLERDFESRAEAIEMFRRLHNLVTQKELQAMGFKRA